MELECDRVYWCLWAGCNKVCKIIEIVVVSTYPINNSHGSKDTQLPRLVDVIGKVQQRALLTIDIRLVIQVDDTYEIRPLELGRSDGNLTEVLGGLQAGDRYVVENSYLIKADIEKSGASHDH